MKLLSSAFSTSNKSHYSLPIVEEHLTSTKVASRQRTNWSQSGGYALQFRPQNLHYRKVPPGQNLPNVAVLCSMQYRWGILHITACSPSPKSRLFCHFQNMQLLRMQYDVVGGTASYSRTPPRYWNVACCLTFKHCLPSSCSAKASFTNSA
jgi:hypothetical protein